ncbi:MAG: hypothetical protein DMF67_14240 [Acidobacteria bacterium]|nr:MAG: hypothetical protein DMF67_14240 [Acidobacteriota bacterium]
MLLGRFVRAAYMWSKHADERERHCLPKEGDECGSYWFTGFLVARPFLKVLPRPDIYDTAMTAELTLGLHKGPEPITRG